MRKGDPVYLCFCGIANFRNYKLGFDREFFVGSATEEQARVYETAVAAQQAALAAIRPGITCETSMPSLRTSTDKPASPRDIAPVARSAARSWNPPN